MSTCTCIRVTSGGFTTCLSYCVSHRRDPVTKFRAAGSYVRSVCAAPSRHYLQGSLTPAGHTERLEPRPPIAWVLPAPVGASGSLGDPPLILVFLSCSFDVGEGAASRLPPRTSRAPLFNWREACSRSSSRPVPGVRLQTPLGTQRHEELPFLCHPGCRQDTLGRGHPVPLRTDPLQASCLFTTAEQRRFCLPASLGIQGGLGPVASWLLPAATGPLLVPSPPLLPVGEWHSGLCSMRVGRASHAPVGPQPRVGTGQAPCRRSLLLWGGRRSFVPDQPPGPGARPAFPWSGWWHYGSCHSCRRRPGKIPAGVFGGGGLFLGSS